MQVSKNKSLYREEKNPIAALNLEEMKLWKAMRA